MTMGSRPFGHFINHGVPAAYVDEFLEGLGLIPEAVASLEIITQSSGARRIHVYRYTYTMQGNIQFGSILPRTSGALVDVIENE